MEDRKLTGLAIVTRRPSCSCRSHRPRLGEPTTIGLNPPADGKKIPRNFMSDSNFSFSRFGPKEFVRAPW